MIPSRLRFILYFIISVSVLDVSGAEIANCYQGRALFTVTMPQFDDDVIYDIDLFQYPNPADTLLGFDYLISWRPRSQVGAGEGFSAYFAGNHYRYSGHKLQEYHYSVDSLPFCVGKGRIGGVHRAAQFVNLLPSVVAEEISTVTGDSAYTFTHHRDTVVDGIHCRGIDIDMRVGGVVARESEYLFDIVSGLPVRIRNENNPGSITEQSVWVEYSDSTFMPCASLTEEQLISMYPDAFGRYRQSTFRIDNLPGSPLPGFSLPTIGQERYSRRESDGFHEATAVVLLSADGGFTESLIEAVRAGVDQMAYPVSVIWVFTDNHVDSITDIVGDVRRGETLLISGESLARDCGVAAPPAIVMVGKDGIVRYVSVGFNKDITLDVIQKMTLLSQ